MTDNDDLITRARERALSVHHLRDDRHLLDDLADALERSEQYREQQVRDLKKAEAEVEHLRYVWDRSGKNDLIESVEREKARAHKAETQVEALRDHKRQMGIELHESVPKYIEAERDRLRAQVQAVRAALDTTDDPSASSAEILADIRAVLDGQED